MPVRVQLSRRRGWRKPAGSVVVARPSRWGNPFRVGDPDPERAGRIPDLARAVELYRGLSEKSGSRFRDRARAELGGRDLACWCPPDGPCHADVLLKLANPPADGTPSG